MKQPLTSRDATQAAAPLLLVTQMYPPGVGGTAVLFENVYARLQERLDIIALVDRTQCSGSETHRGRVQIERTEIEKWRRGIVPLEDLRQHWALARQIRRLSNDMKRRSPARQAPLVHCGRAMPEALAALFGRRLLFTPRYVVWAHGEEITTARMSREYHWVMGRVYRNATAVIANSHQTARLVKSFQIADERLRVVHPGVDVKRFHPGIDGSAIRNKVVPPGRLMLLTVGRFPPRKGHDKVIAAMAKLRHHNPPLHYVIAGDGDGDERPRLERIVAEHGVGDLVSFVGVVQQDQLPSYYAACDIFLMPNRTEGADVEGFGIVYLEAAACGKPTIGGRSGGVPEAVADGESGLLVDGTDVDDLAAAISKLASSAQLRRQMGEKGRRRAEAQFTWDRAADKTFELHRELTEP